MRFQDSLQTPIIGTLFFPIATEQGILDMQYALAKHRNMQPDEHMSTKSLLYFYSLFQKDLQEQKEQALMQKALNESAGRRARYGKR